MRNIFTYLIVVAFSISGAAQSVVFNISPGGGFVRIGGSVLDLSKTRTITLNPGTYDAEIWVPKFAVNHKEVVVVAGRQAVVNLAMKNRADEFDEFQDELSRFRAAKLKQNLTGGVVVGLVAGFTYIAVKGKRKELREQEAVIENRRTAYSSAVSVSQIEEVIRQYDNAVAAYEKTEKSHNTLVVATAVLATASTLFAVKYFTRKSRLKAVKPIFETNNPFVDVSPMPSPILHLGTSISPIGLTLKF